MAEYPSPIYFPSAKIILIPRFEEFGNKTAVPAPPKKRAPVRKGTGKDNTEALEVKLVDGAYVIMAKEANPNQVGGPQEQKSGDDDEVVLIPRAARLSRDGFTKGATLDLELRYQDFPIDPRTIRSAAVEFYLGHVREDDFQRGVMGERRDVNAGGMSEALHIVPSTYSHNGIARTNLRFQGFVDEFETEWDDQEPIVRLRCADNTRLLIDQDAPPQLSIDPKLPIHEATARYLANFPQFAGLRVRYDGENPPKIQDALGKTAYQPKLGPAPKKKGDGSADKMAVWDYLNDVAGAVGLMVRLIGVTIIFQYPRQLMAGAKERRDDDPYRPRRVKSRVYTRRTFVYGRNIETMGFSKQFGKASTQNIEIRCYHAKRKKVLVARFPLKEDRITDVKPGAAAENKWFVIRVRAVENEKVLKAIAQSYYEARSRAELLVKFTTRNLSSYGGFAEDTDVLDMLPGDSFEVETNREEEVFSSVVRTEDELVKRSEQYLVGLGYNQSFASRYAKAFLSIGIQSIFKVRKIGIEWSSDDGVQIEVEGINYVTVRADKVLGVDNRPEPEKLDEGQGDTVEDTTVEKA